MRSVQPLLAIMTALVLFAACGSDSTTEQSASSQNLPVVVATTNILGDVVANLAGDAVDVVVIMPIGSDPHSFQPSAQQIAAIDAAGVIIANGAGFEEGLLDAVEAAESRGAVVFEAMSAIDSIDISDDKHDGDDDHDDDEHGDDDHDHGSDGQDPHFFTDPVRMARAVEGIADFLATNVDGIDQDALQASATEYIDELEALDAEVEALLATIPDAGRVLVTNHEVFGYFADRYDFEVVGTVIPNGSSSDGVSGQRLAALAALLEQEAVSAVFTDTSSSDELARTLAREVGEVEVVALFSESLGDQNSDGASYVDMVRTNAMRIAEALAS